MPAAAAAGRTRGRAAHAAGVSLVSHLRHVSPRDFWRRNTHIPPQTRADGEEQSGPPPPIARLSSSPPSRGHAVAHTGRPRVRVDGGSFLRTVAFHLFLPNPSIIMASSTLLLRRTTSRDDGDDLTRRSLTFDKSPRLRARMSCIQQQHPLAPLRASSVARPPQLFVRPARHPEPQPGRRPHLKHTRQLPRNIRTAACPLPSESRAYPAQVRRQRQTSVMPSNTITYILQRMDVSSTAGSGHRMRVSLCATRSFSKWPRMSR